MRRLAVIILVFQIFSGCAQPVLEKTSRNYSKEAYDLAAAGKWKDAAEPARRAILNANSASSTDNRKAMLHYEYGRILGVTCSFLQAEENLKIAYNYDKSAQQPLYLSLVELARLNYDQKKFKQASEYYSEAIQEIRKAKLDIAAPVDFSEILFEQAESYNQIELKKESVILKKEAETIKKKFPNDVSATDRTPYGKYCPNTEPDRP